MDVFCSDSKGPLISIPSLLPYNPHPYEQTKRREGQPCVDYIMLWDDSGSTWTLCDVHPERIKIGWRSQFEELQEQESETIENMVSIHDPIKAYLVHQQNTQ